MVSMSPVIVSTTHQDLDISTREPVAFNEAPRQLLVICCKPVCADATQGSPDVHLSLPMVQCVVTSLRPTLLALSQIRVPPR